MANDLFPLNLTGAFADGDTRSTFGQAGVSLGALASLQARFLNMAGAGALQVVTSHGARGQARIPDFVAVASVDPDGAMRVMGVVGPWPVMDLLGGFIDGDHVHCKYGRFELNTLALENLKMHNLLVPVGVFLSLLKSVFLFRISLNPCTAHTHDTRRRTLTAAENRRIVE